MYGPILPSIMLMISKAAEVLELQPLWPRGIYLSLLLRDSKDSCMSCIDTSSRGRVCAGDDCGRAYVGIGMGIG